MTTDMHMGHYFRKLHFQLEQNMNRQVQELELTRAQSHIIGLLMHREEAPCARDLEAAFDLSHATVSGLLSRMEAKGFIEVRPDPKDRRVKRIYILERGMVSSKQIEANINRIEQQIVSGFTEEEVRLFRSFLVRSCENLSQNAQENQSKREE